MIVGGIAIFMFYPIAWMSVSYTHLTAAKTEAADGQATQEAKTEAPAASGESIRVAWWGNQKRADATIAAFDAFAKESGVNFTYEYNSYDAYWETLATQSVGNNLPGIVQQVTDQYAGYILSLIHIWS